MCVCVCVFDVCVCNYMHMLGRPEDNLRDSIPFLWDNILISLEPTI